MVVVSLDVARANFARFVRRGLVSARQRGLTDDKIAELTGVGDSTFHRWAKGEWKQRPKIDNVVKFCVGLGLDQQEALRALGIADDRLAPPEPITTPEVRAIERMLNDPHLSAEEKAFILQTLRMLTRVGLRARADRRSVEQPEGSDVP